MSQQGSEIFKILLAGDVSTGKTSFLSQLIFQIPERNPKPTDRLSFFSLRITSPDALLQIWDSPGDPRYHFQVVSGLGAFRAGLLFVDVTNEHTFLQARTLVEELRCYGQLQLHVVESKAEVTVRDRHKRKVQREQLEALAESVRGTVLEYRRDQPIEPILQRIVEWKPAPNPKPAIKPQSVSQMTDPACECAVY